MNWAAIAVGITLALCGASTARAAAPIAVGEALHFAAGWRTAGPAAQNVLQPGTAYPCDQGWCVHVEELQGRDNLPRQRLAHRHAMQARDGATTLDPAVGFAYRPDLVSVGRYFRKH